MLALIAHDTKKDDMVALAKKYHHVLAGRELVATGTTGQILIDNTGLPVHRMKSGPYGGDAQIGALVAEDKIEAVIFLVDPLYAHPHEPDVQSLQRICNVHNVPLASNLASAEIMLQFLGSKVQDMGTG